MNNLIKNTVSPFFVIVLLFGVSSCFFKKGHQLSEGTYGSSYDDTTLTVDNHSVLLPYNRFVDPAGSVIRFGKVSLENHSLDLALLPISNQLVVEDRYGLAF